MDDLNMSCLPFYKVTDFELCELCECSKDHFSNRLIENGIKDYVLQHCLIDSDFSFNYYNENKLNSEIRKKQSTMGLSVFHLNIRSLNHNHQKLILYMETLKIQFDIIVLSELWSYNISFYQHVMDGYAFVYDLPKATNIGGIGMFVKKDIEYTVKANYTQSMSLLPNNFVENLWLEVKKGKDLFIVGGIYRHPNGDINDFSDTMDLIMSEIRKEKKTVIITGDFNVNLMNFDKNAAVQSYLNNILMNDFLPVILMPTRITDHTSTLIDHIYIHQPPVGNNYSITAGNMYADITDHLPNFVLLNSNHQIKISNNRKMIRLTSDKYIQQFKSSLATVNWQSVITATDAEIAYEMFITSLSEKYEQCFPLVFCSRKRSKDKPWITTGLKHSSKTKNRLFKKWITRKKPYDKLKYEQYLKIFKKCVAQSRTDYYKEIFCNRKENIKNMWMHLGYMINPSKHNKSKTNINRLKLHNKLITDAQTISEELNSYFCSVGEKLAKTLPLSQTNFSKYMKFWVSNSMFLTPVTPQELLEQIRGLNPSKSPGPDNISPKIVQHAADELVNPLTHIYNTSLNTGVVPSALKISKVIAIFKKGDTEEPGNYRPISLLSIFDKLLEKLIHCRLMNFLNNNNVLNNNQFGFRSKHSTTLALLELVDTLYKNLDGKQIVAGIYLDLKKAFDTVDHNILLRKLYVCGIRGNTLNWFQSYLSNRQQYVTVNGCTSHHKPVRYGVPQGSVLGPLLFLLYINDINIAVEGEKLKLYADDTNLFLNDSDPDILCSRSNLCLDSLHHWFLANKLSVNLDKTVFSIFFPNKFQATLKNFKLYIDNKEIKRVDCSKYLGVMLDEKLNWKNHIDYIVSKMVKFTGLFYKIRHNLTSACRKALYFALIYPHVTYSIELFGNATDNNIHGLQMLQNKLLRILQMKEPRYPTNMLYKNYDTFKIRDLHEISFLILAHKIIYHPDKLPTVYRNYFRLNSDTHDHCTRNKYNICPPQIRTNIGAKDFRFKSHQLWNGLTEDIKLTENISQFRSKIRQLYLAKY